ncbi:MAG TPA: DUF4139 domain-containing protein [Fimbriimonadaceae bacterium]|nr:DUF4139 domain-containing protein [Fimbriimonadaceae bacterium]
MKSDFALVVSLAVVVYALTGCSRSSAQSRGTESDRQIELVVFTNDFAQVQEKRGVTLKEGLQRIDLVEISPEIDPQSTVFSWPNAKQVEVVSSTYELGAPESSSLLQRFVGKKVELVYRGENGREGERQEGVLQTAERGNLVVKVGDRLVVNPTATLELPADSGVATMPQLSLQVKSDAPQNTQLDFSYLTRGLSWSADYTLTLAPESDRIDLECWATVSNTTGTEFTDAKIRFVAGSPNRAVRPALDPRERMSKGAVGTMEWSPADGAGFSPPVTMGEMYAYPYEATATIRPDQMNRARMFSANGVSIERDYSIRLSDLTTPWYAVNPAKRFPATLTLNFKNSEAVGLGSPLPAGTLRIYESTPKASPSFIGASQIVDTPRDGSIHATLSNVFDLSAQARIVETKRIAKDRSARTIEIIVTNAKRVPATTRVVHSAYAGWTLEQESDSSTAIDAQTREWRVIVPAGSSKTIRFTAVIRG